MKSEPLAGLITDASFWTAEYVTPSAWVEHAPFSYWLIENLKPRTYVELGTHNGFSYFGVCQAVTRLGLPTQCYAVDTWQGDEHAGFYKDDVYEKVARRNAEKYASFSHLIRATFSEAVSRFEDGSIDLLHVDGRHFYDDVKEDFETWRPKLSDRAVVIFHDTQVRERDFGVYKYWAELASEHPHFEFHHGYGLGVLGIGSDFPEPIRHLFGISNDPQSSERLRSMYARLGLTEALRLEVGEDEMDGEGSQENEIEDEGVHKVLRQSRRAGKLKEVLLERERELAAAQREVQALRNSTSYRITAPLRKAVVVSRSLTRNASAVRTAMRQRGGLVPSVQKALYVLRNYGLTGVRHRLRTLAHLEHRYTQVPKTVNSRPFVSVIVPNYNHARYLKKRLDTILGQTYTHYEIILLDDCSTDDSLEILRQYEKMFPRKVRLVVNEENSGSGYRQWAKGLAMAKGELVWIAESDDWSAPDFLASLISAFEDESVMLAYTNSAFMDAEGKKFIWSTTEYLIDIDPRQWSRAFKLPANQLVKNGWAIKNLVPNVSSAVFRNPGPGSELLKGPWTGMKICGDWLFYLNLIRGGTVVYQPEMRNFYRVHDTSTAKGTFVKDVYYREHADVAKFVLETFDVSEQFVLKQEKNLRQHWQAHRDDYSEGRLKACYDPAEIVFGRGERRPAVLMCGYAFAAGGGETFPIFVANLLKARDYTVTFLSCEMAEREAGVRNLLRADIPVLTEPFSIAAIIEDFGIDIVHSHHGWVDGFIADRVPKSSPVRKVVSMHGMYEMMEPIDQDAVVKKLAQSSDALIYTSLKNLEPFKRLGLEHSPKLTGIPNALPDVPINPVDRATLGIPDGAFVVCIVSRAIPEKGWEEAIEAVERARLESGRDIQLLLIGEGPEYERLRQPDQVGSFVKLLGFKRNLRDYFAMADIGLLPSRFKGESFPLTLIDCLAAGKPFVASDVGEIRHMLDAGGELAGEVFALDDWRLPVGQMASILAKASERGSDYQRMAAAVPGARKKFDPSLMVDRYIAVYDRIMHGKPPGGEHE